MMPTAPPKPTLDEGSALPALVLRSFAVQGSWNPRTLLGAGFAFALLPALRCAYRDDPAGLAAAVGRHAALFNCHPYLATIALGAVARLEQERAEPDAVRRLKQALVGPLGTLGDRLVWARWRPLCALVAVAALALGFPWWAACLLFWVPYNALHVALRTWGARLGWREGWHIGRALAASPVRHWPDRLTAPLGLAAGAAWVCLAGTLAAGTANPGGWLEVLGLGGLGAAAGLLWPALAARAVGVLVGAAALGSAFVGGAW